MMHPSMLQLKGTLVRAASASINVLILGETGVGKDIAASMIHELSPRASGPFVRLNCAAIPEALLESELFGHESRAFTGAGVAKPGLLESADGGTVFLDEIGDLPLSIQAKLLRAIDTREILRLGALRPRPIDVRFVAATNRDLVADVAAGHFRQDLLYRLNTLTVTVPPLRKRRCEIIPLAQLLLKDACARFQLPEPGFCPESVAVLENFSWPGNVRELRNVIERAVVLVTGAQIEPEHLGVSLLPGEDLAGESPSKESLVDQRLAAPPKFDPSWKSQIEGALKASGGNQSKAAMALGMPRRTFVRRLARLGLPRPRAATAGVAVPSSDEQ